MRSRRPDRTGRPQQARTNEACFKRGGCFDVRVRCGGWGHIVVEGRVLDRAEADALHAAQG